MARMRTARDLAHRWTDLFALVLDLQDYPRFVPHCRDVRLIRRSTDAAGRTVIVSRMEVGLSALRVSYANRTVADPVARRIEVTALDGPLRRLDVIWTFEPRGRHTRVEFAVDYEFDSAALAALASALFEAMFSRIMDAFERRAEQLFAAARRHARHAPRAGNSSIAT